MKDETFNWNTEFDTANDLMIHTFSNRVKVCCNIKTGEAKTLRDGEVISRRDDMLMSEYEQFLIRTAEEAAKLQELDQ